MKHIKVLTATTRKKGPAIAVVTDPDALRIVNAWLCKFITGSKTTPCN